MVRPKLCCPSCGQFESTVIGTLPDEVGGAVVRDRQCLHCGRRFETEETVRRLLALPPRKIHTSLPDDFRTSSRAP